MSNVQVYWRPDRKFTIEDAMILIAAPAIGMAWHGDSAEVFVRLQEFMYQSPIPWAILGAWAWVWISGRWRRSLGWEERVGRWYGWVWISIILWYVLGWSVLWG